MRYLVTGAAGFLGTNLCLNLLEDGNEVVGLDNLSTGFSRNLELLKKNPDFSFVQHDVVLPLPGLGEFSFFYNLACPASPPRYQKDPLQTFRTSIWGAWNAIEYVRKTGTPLFHTSTSEVYGDPSVHPQKETYWGNVNPIGIRACYDEGKRGAEAMLSDYFRASGNPIKIVRIFNTYGPHMDPSDGRVISNFLNQAIEGKPLTIYGDGTQSRSFCYVSDLIAGMRRMEKSPAEFIGPVNIGNPTEFTLLELIDSIESVLGKKPEVEFLPLPGDDPKQRRPDISLAKEKLNWEPKVQLKEGLGKTLSYFREIREG
ncbi:SDR family oxidoreductase [Candidatus Micrarchaeota archaeon]|nr:SDR family oxidoreductase [Candidatus Micrarchaeota archaeon]